MSAKFPIKFYLIILFLGFQYFSSYAQMIKRICVAPLTREISFVSTPPKDTCSKISKVIYYGFNTGTGLKTKLDSTSSFIADYTIKSTIFTNLKDSFFMEFVTDCPSTIRTKSLKFDITPPDIIKMDSISINNQKAVMSWKPSNTIDVKGYIIYKSSGVVNNPIDTLFGKFNTFYEDKLSNPTQRLAYRVAAIDSCNNVADLGPIDSSILLSVDTKPCSNTITISATPYSGWNVQKYELYMSENNNPFKLIHTRVGFIKSFQFNGIKEKTKYQFFVRAYQAGNPIITSSSNVQALVSSLLNRPNYFYINKVTALKNNPLIQIKTDSFQFIKSIKIYKSTDSLRYIPLLTVNGLFSSGLIDVIDNIINLENPPKKVFYKFEIIDECNNKSALSKAFRMLIPSILQNNNTATLTWNKVSEWKNTTYNIYKNTELPDSSKWKLIGSTDSTQNTFEDIQNDGIISNAGICYYIQAKGYHLNDSFNSEELDLNSYRICIPEALKVFYPNAFIINGLNPNFKISYLGVDEAVSEYSIYNRWGQNIFNGNIKDVWDGTYKGKRVGGLYLLRLIYFDAAGNRYESKGTVQVLE